MKSLGICYLTQLASETCKAKFKSSVFANLHSPIVSTNPNITNSTNAIITVIVLLSINAQTSEIIIGTIK